MFGMGPGFFNNSSASPYWYDALFQTGDVGMVFDPNRLDNIYQDSGGTVPCTAAGQSVLSMRDVKGGGLIVLSAGSATLQFDSSRSKYYLSIGATCNFGGTGIVPSALAGDSPISIVVGGTFSSSNQFGSFYIGPSYPSNPSTGNAIFLGNLNDPTNRLDFLQFGTGRGISAGSGAANGTVVVAGIKSGASGGTHTMTVYDFAKTGSPLSGIPSANITALNCNIGRALGAGNLYLALAVNRAISGAELSVAYANAL